jgi:hypothetical protein
MHPVSTYAPAAIFRFAFKGQKSWRRRRLVLFLIFWLRLSSLMDQSDKAAASAAIGLGLKSDDDILIECWKGEAINIAAVTM